MPSTICELETDFASSGRFHSITDIAEFFWKSMNIHFGHNSFSLSLYTLLPRWNCELKMISPWFPVKIRYINFAGLQKSTEFFTKWIFGKISKLNWLVRIWCNFVSRHPCAVFQHVLDWTRWVLSNLMIYTFNRPTQAELSTYRSMSIFIQKIMKLGYTPLSR